MSPRFPAIAIVAILAAVESVHAWQSATPAPPDTAVITGRVFDGRTGRPLRRASVRLESRDAGAQFLMTSGADGTFSFHGLAAGRYQVNAQRGGFGIGGFAIDLRAGEVLQRADITLRPGGVIVGRLVDEFGDSAPDIAVSAVRFYTDIYGYRVQDVGGRDAVTDDIGEFRIWGLRPGDYHVMARPGDRAPTYAPAASGVSDAWRFEVEPDVTYDAHIMLMDAKALSITGIVSGANGRPFTGRTNVAHGSIRVYEQRTRTFVGSAASELRPDGTFRISGLEPGDYLIEIVGNTSPDDEVAEVAHANVALSTSDLDNVMMRAVKPSTLTGRVTLKDGSRSALNLSSVKVYASYIDHFIQVNPAAVGNDLTFSLKAYPGDNALLLLNYGPPGWALSAVRLNGRDVTDRFDVRAGEDIGGIEVVLTNRPTVVSGKVVDDEGQAPRAPFVGVIVFAQDPDLRRTGTGQWWVRATKDGTFNVKVRPGDYYVAAVDDLNMSQAFDPGILENLTSTAQTVSADEGHRSDIELRVRSGRR